jgi:CPA2 family monovalent cation:H+ antiporter-2/glutathione-regulated potassium-efflux system ancillary protein KefC
MFLTPGLFILYDKVILPRFEEINNTRDADEINETGTVVIAGAGRFGQIVTRLLSANDVTTTVLDIEPVQIDNLKKINIKSYYGDATRPDLLHTAGIEKAAAIVVAIDNKEASKELVVYIKHTYPNVKIIARAFDRGHSYALRLAGADTIISETYYSALEAGKQALNDVGFHPFQVEQQKNAFVSLEEAGAEKLYTTWRDASEEDRYNVDFQKLFIELEEAISSAMNSDRADKHARTERGWTPPPKGYADVEQLK